MTFLSFPDSDGREDSNDGGDDDDGDDQQTTDNRGLNPNPDYDFSNRFGGFTKTKSTLQFDGRTLPLRKYSFLMSRLEDSSA